MVRRNKVTAGVPHDRAVQLFHGLDDIFAEAVLIGQGVSGVVDAAVDAATHVSGDVSGQSIIGRVGETYSVKPP